MGAGLIHEGQSALVLCIPEWETKICSARTSYPPSARRWINLADRVAPRRLPENSALGNRPCLHRLVADLDIRACADRPGGAGSREPRAVADPDVVRGVRRPSGRAATSLPGRRARSASAVRGSPRRWTATSPPPRRGPKCGQVRVRCARPVLLRPGLRAELAVDLRTFPECLRQFPSLLSGESAYGVFRVKMRHVVILPRAHRSYCDGSLLVGIDRRLLVNSNAILRGSAICGIVRVRIARADGRAFRAMSGC
ncbi:hypothetical protein BJ970_006254 [Saccharopolyspora phatthalungensis]|uniref:Uncharacterized protein n=1 Tax=Saccharopolyspora phatthalungensis TaxID=664693 RepID=A0A840QIY8_9PSEU|nr:hypothetical protein [Saccharopolyspora phatthalungensis]